MYSLRTASVLIALSMILACSSRMTYSTKDMPEWYLNPPQEEAALHGVGEASGQDLGLTRQDAQAAARDEIAQQTEIKISNMIIRSKQAVGGQIDANVIRSTSRQIVDLTATNIAVIERKIITTKDGYIVYALARMPLASLQEAARTQLAQEEIRRQLEINDNLQEIMNLEIANMNGQREQP